MKTVEIVARCARCGQHLTFATKSEFTASVANFGLTVQPHVCSHTARVSGQRTRLMDRQWHVDMLTT